MQTRRTTLSYLAPTLIVSTCFPVFREMRPRVRLLGSSRRPFRLSESTDSTFGILPTAARDQPHFPLVAQGPGWNGSPLITNSVHSLQHVDTTPQQTLCSAEESQKRSNLRPFEGSLGNCLFANSRGVREGHSTRGPCLHRVLQLG